MRKLRSEKKCGFSNSVPWTNLLPLLCLRIIMIGRVIDTLATDYNTSDAFITVSSPSRRQEYRKKDDPLFRTDYWATDTSSNNLVERENQRLDINWICWSIHNKNKFLKLQSKHLCLLITGLLSHALKHYLNFVVGYWKFVFFFSSIIAL